MKKTSRVGYQCFVDSFAAGARSVWDKKDLYPSDVYGRPVKLLNWNEDYDDYCYGNAFYGGDLRGVINSAEGYLSQLGVDMLYLTPIFEGKSNHKYDTLDYKHVDKTFGSLEDFKELVRVCGEKKINLILDGVFNHTSSRHDWFLKAQEGMAPYKDYYKKNEEGYYLKWNGVDSLMLLNHENKDVRDYLYDEPGSIIDYWLDLGADGWRLDVAERLTEKVIRKIKKAISSRFPDKVLIGEVIETYGKKWLGPDLLDGVMNYVFLGNTVNFLKKSINGEKYLFELNKMYEEYPKKELFQSWNIISSHDTHRMIHEVNGNENLFKMAVVMQFAYPGIPIIYNGDELGVLPGEKEKDHRKGMDWDRSDILKLREMKPEIYYHSMDWDRVNEYSSFYHFYKHMIWLKKEYEVLNRGEFYPAFSSEDITSFFRIKDGHFALIVINRGDRSTINLEVPREVWSAKPLLKGEHGPITGILIDSPQIEINIEKENSLLFVN